MLASTHLRTCVVAVDEVRGVRDWPSQHEEAAGIGPDGLHHPRSAVQKSAASRIVRHGARHFPASQISHRRARASHMNSNSAGVNGGEA